MSRFPMMLLTMFLLASDHARGDDKPPSPLKNQDDEYQYFILTTTKAKVYEKSTGDALLPQPKPLQLGDVYFAQGKLENDRVHLGEFDAKKKEWASTLGWVAATELIANRVSPLTVGQALERGLTVQRSDEIGGLNPSNVLHLRCVSQPDAKLQPGSAPLDKGGKPIITFVWFYIYDIQVVDGKPWLLAGHRTSLSSETAIAGDSQDPSPSKNLLGWLPLDKISLWCTNFVLEYNTSADSVNRRIEKKRPAIVHAHRKVDSAPLFTEPLEILSTILNNNGAAHPSIALDPIGLHPDYPRFVVIQSWPGEWVEVASVGTQDGSLTQPQIAMMKIKIDETLKSLRKVDIVYVIDTTTSMGDEIATVAKFLGDLSQKFRDLQFQGTTVDIPIPGEDPLRLSVDLDIRISLISYNETATTRFTSLDLKNQLPDILRGLNDLKLSGFFEALHPGMIAGLAPGVWRGDCATRLVVLVGDEPGDTHTPELVLKAMMPMSEDQLRIAPEYRSLSEADRKKKVTPIYGIYTGEDVGEGLNQFKANVDPFAVATFSAPALKSADQRKRYGELFHGLIKERQEKIKTELDYFVDELSQKPRDPASLPGVSRIAVEEAARRNGMTIEQFRAFSKIVFFQGFANLHDADWSPGKENPPPDPFRIRVMLSHDELTSLVASTEMIGHALDKALNALKIKDDLPISGMSPKGRKLMLCKIFILTQDFVIGGGRKSKDIDEQLQKEAENLLDYINEGKGDAKMTRLLRIPDSLPIRADSILALNLKEFVNAAPSRLRKEADWLILKAKGLKRIRNNQVVPEDFLLVEDPKHAPGNRAKYWFTTQSPESTETYTYVPIGYIP